MDVTVSVDFPAGKFRLKFPDSFVIVPMETLFFMNTLTPDRAVPFLSLTVPVMVFCPTATKENARKANRKIKNSFFGNNCVKKVDFINLI